MPDVTIDRNNASVSFYTVVRDASSFTLSSILLDSIRSPTSSNSFLLFATTKWRPAVSGLPLAALYIQPTKSNALGRQEGITSLSPRHFFVSVTTRRSVRQSFKTMLGTRVSLFILYRWSIDAVDRRYQYFTFFPSRMMNPIKQRQFFRRRSDSEYDTPEIIGWYPITLAVLFSYYY